MAQIMCGSIIIGLVLYYTPILDLLYLFAMVVLVPIAFMGGFSLVFRGTARALLGSMGTENLAARTRAYRDYLKNAKTDEEKAYEQYMQECANHWKAA